MRGILEPDHLLIILLVVVFMFGGKKIPELAGSLGKGVSEFKRGLHGANAPEPQVTSAAAEPRPLASAEPVPTVDAEPKRLLV